ncbi:MAG: DsrE/DsrF/DrsH-like family protein [Thermoproteus sp.]
MPEKISMIVFTGTDDKLIPVGVISQAAAALGYEVHVFFTGWAMFKLLKEPLPEVWPKEFEQMVPRLKEGMARIKAPTWKDMLKQAKEMGAKVYVCSMMAEAAGLKKEHFDPALVDDVVGVTTFLERAKGGQILFI